MDTEERNNKSSKVTETELIQYFNSETNPKEQERIEAWIGYSTENKNLAETIYMATLASDTYLTIKNITTDDALKKVNSKIRKKRINIGTKWARQIAAILFIPLLAATTFLLLKDSNKDIEYISFKTNPGIVADFKLPDGTKVWLNAHSSLTYPSRFTGNKREITLSGEAYFKVKENQKQPFVVKLSNNMEIEVTGTEFNVDAYEKYETITAMLVSGGVKVNYPYPIKGSDCLRLKPGQKIIFEKATSDIKLMYASSLVETCWKDGTIYLENTSLEHLLRTLSKRFDVDFVLEREELKDNYFTGTFASQELDMILKHLDISSGIKHRREERGLDEKGQIRIYLY